MKKYMLLTLLTVLVWLIAASCSDDSGTDPGDTDQTTGAAKVIDAQASECYGFVTAKPATGEYPEILTWSYDAATETLVLHHAALILNCCGVHTVDASYDNGIVTIYEDDQPEPEGGRCHCLCPFDFKVTFENIPEQELGVRIELTVDDTTTEHWAGAIELAEGGGIIPMSAAF